MFQKWLLMFVLILLPGLASAQDVCVTLNGAALLAQDGKHTYLGRISNKYDAESIFNEYGNFGSEYSASSIWNEYGQFGGEYSAHSPFNEYSNSPPLIVKNRKVIGYLSVNQYLTNQISPNLLRELCGR